MTSGNNITVWQIYVEGWRYATPELAAFVSHNRPGAVRLADMSEPTGIRRARFTNKPVIKGVTPQRLAAARAAIRKARDRAGLFADYVPEANQQPDERIADYDLARIEQHLEDRQRQAEQWRRARHELARLHPSDHRAILFRWNTAGCPAEPVFLLDHIHQFKTRKQEDAA